VTCGTIDLSIEDVTLYLVAGTSEPTYGFQCPQCLRVVRKSTTSEAVALLVAAGVRVIEVPREAREPHPGDPLTERDLLLLSRALADNDLLALFAEHQS
jgi:hypothetical protein